MIINKITTGFVIQTYDTEKKQYVSQTFTAGDQVDYETSTGHTLTDGELVEIAKENGFGPYAENEPYLPFEMVQPVEKGKHVFNDVLKRCIRCGCDEDDAFVGGQPCIDGEEN